MKKADFVGYAMINGIRFELFYDSTDYFSAWKVVIEEDIFGLQYYKDGFIGEMINFTKLTAEERNKLEIAK